MVFLARPVVNGFKLREGRFRLDIRKEVFYNEGGETLAQVAQRGSRGSTLETFKVKLDGALSNLTYCLLQRGLG